MTILYEVHNNLYVNLTNKCPCACTFCLRQTRDHMENSGVLWLEREPSVQEIIDDFANFDIDNAHINNLIDEGKAEFVLHIESPATSYRLAKCTNQKSMKITKSL